MNTDINIAEAAIYVGTYKKYNEGSLFGEWLKLSDYTDKTEFYAACEKLHKDEHDPEYMFQDYENIPESLVNESWISERFFEVRDAMENLSETQQEAFLIWCTNGHQDLGKEDIDDLMTDFDNLYIGQYENDEDYAWELIEERDDLNDFAKQYFDIEAFARDLFLGDYWSDGGFVFRH